MKSILIALCLITNCVSADVSDDYDVKINIGYMCEEMIIFVSDQMDFIERTDPQFLQSPDWNQLYGEYKAYHCVKWWLVSKDFPD